MGASCFCKRVTCAAYRPGRDIAPRTVRGATLRRLPSGARHCAAYRPGRDIAPLTVRGATLRRLPAQHEWSDLPMSQFHVQRSLPQERLGQDAPRGTPRRRGAAFKGTVEVQSSMDRTAVSASRSDRNSPVSLVVRMICVARGQRLEDVGTQSGYGHALEGVGAGRRRPRLILHRGHGHCD
jgi:hypothetical protein